MSSTDHVVIVGAGFAGVACAKKLAEDDVAVTLIDRNTYHQFQPLLYQVATTQLAPTDIMRPLRGLFRKHPSVAVKEAEVIAVDLEQRSVTTRTGETFAGDHLVLAMGAKPAFFGVPGAAEHAYPLYSAPDAVALRNRVLQVFEDADLEPARIEKGALNFVVVGAGATGVETAGALADLVHDVMPSRYHDLAVNRACIHLVDHGDVVLGGFSDKAHAYAAKTLRRKGVRLRLGTSVQEIAEDEVSLSDGTVIATHCVVWAGGLQARSFDGLDAVDRGRGGRLTAGVDLSLDGFPGVYAVGDVANVRAPDGEAYPQLGSVAMQAGGAVAASISARIAGSPPPGFNYHDKGIMAMIGRHAAVAELGSHHHELHGPVAFSAWLGVHAWLMSSNRARIDSFISWAWDAFSKNRMPGFIDAPDEPRIDWGDRDEAPASDSAAADDTSAGNPKGTT